METPEKILTPEESLQLIGQTIANYKRNYKEESYYFLLWGWLSVVASISQYLIIKILCAYQYYHWINTLSFVNWGFFLAVAMFIQYRHHYKRVISVASHLSKFIKLMWQVNGMAIIISIFLSFKFKTYPVPLILLIVGIPTLITGGIIKFKPLILGGLAFFAFSILASFYPNENQLLIYAVALVLGYLVPGYLLKSAKE